MNADEKKGVDWIAAAAVGGLGVLGMLCAFGHHSRWERWRQAEAEARERAQRIAFGKVQRAKETERALFRALQFQQAGR